jgi:hypothetical protein
MELSEKILGRTTEMVEETFCWRWKGSMQGGKPYGKISAAGKTRSVHRVAYEVFRDGKEIEGKQIHHTCLNKRCCNPWHMEAVTREEHVARHREGQVGWGRRRISEEERVERARERRRADKERYPDKWRERIRGQNARAKARHPDKYRAARRAQKVRYKARYPEKWQAAQRAKKARYRQRQKIQNLLASFGDPGRSIKAGRLLPA